MPQIINQESAGGRLGSALGTGLGQGLQYLAEHKLNTLLGEKKRKSTLGGLEALGFNPEEAESVSYLSPEIQNQIIKQKIQQPNQEAYAQALQSILGGEPGVPAGIQQQKESSNAFGIPSGLTGEQATKLATLGLQKQQMSEKAKSSAYKETKEERKAILDSAKAARENDMRLARIKELDKKGNLQNPTFYSFMKKVGLDIPSLKSADSQELEKLSNDFLKSAKNVFGSRLTNFDVQTFLSTVPSLAQTKEGRSRVIRNLELFNQGSFAREKALRDILKENKNIPPLDLAEQVEARIQPQLDAIANDFKAGVSQGASGTLEVGTKLSSLPDPSDLPVGTEIKKKDGTKLRNTGSKWEKVS